MRIAESLRKHFSMEDNLTRFEVKLIAIIVKCVFHLCIYTLRTKKNIYLSFEDVQQNSFPFGGNTSKKVIQNQTITIKSFAQSRRKSCGGK